MGQKKDQAYKESNLCFPALVQRHLECLRSKRTIGDNPREMQAWLLGRWHRQRAEGRWQDDIWIAGLPSHLADKKRPEEPMCRSLPKETLMEHLMSAYIWTWDEARGREFRMKLWQRFRKLSKRILIFIQNRKNGVQCISQIRDNGPLHSHNTVSAASEPTPAGLSLGYTLASTVLPFKNQCPHHTLEHSISISG